MTLFSRNAISRGLPTLVAAGSIALVAACGPTPSTNYDTSRRLVFPVVATGPAALDGLATDAAWTNGSFKFLMVHGGPSPTVFRGVADADFVYVYVEVEDTQFNPTDVLVIGLNPSNAANGYRRIHVFPCPNQGMCAANGTAQVPTIQSWKDGTFNGTNWTWVAEPTPAGLEAKVATATGGVTTWSVELKIPRGAPFNLVNSNFFGLFVDVVSTDPNLIQATQYTWPQDQLIGGPDENSVFTDLESGTPAPLNWGNATLYAGFGNGVSITSEDIASNDPTDPSLIQLNATNTFYGTAANYTTQGGTLVTAKGVKATFKIANFGLANNWALVPGGGNPTNAADIGPTSAYTFATGPWNLSPQEKNDYGLNPHQCILVELSSTDVNTIFVNPSAQRNMDFVTTNSPFRATAIVSTKGMERGAGDRKIGFILREDFVNFDPQLTWTTTIDNATPAGKRVYRADIAPASDLSLGITVEPPPVKIPSEQVRIPAGTGGDKNPAVVVPVKAGEVITVISSGTIMVDGRPVTAAGFPNADRKGELKVRTAGPKRIGALLGSFDEFKTSAFVIGNASTIKVPAGAQALHLKIDDDANQYANQKGEGYLLQLVRTPIEPWMVASNPELRREVRGDDVFVTTGANMPTWTLRGERDSGRVIRIGKETYHVYQSVGLFGHILRHNN